MRKYIHVNVKRGTEFGLQENFCLDKVGQCLGPWVSFRLCDSGFSLSDVDTPKGSVVRAIQGHMSLCTCLEEVAM